jgi:hypothetical protein
MLMSEFVQARKDAKDAQRRILDLMHATFPEKRISLTRNTERVRFEGVPPNDCVIAERLGGDVRKPIYFAPSWKKLYELMVDIRKEHLRAREVKPPA